jgi:alpha,alpha-trehalase
VVQDDVRSYPRFPPETLQQYALLGDGERGALIGPRGNVAFMCAPRWQDEGVFASLIGGGGHYAVTPSDDRFTWGGHYESNTLIWRSRWVTTSGVIECREALALPADRDRVVLLRRVEAIAGDARVRVVLDARGDFGSNRMKVSKTESGVWEGSCGKLRLRWCGAPGNAKLDQSCLEGELVVAQGEHHDLVLELGSHGLPDTLLNPDIAWSATAREWTDQIPELNDSWAPGDVAHSYAVLHGLTSQANGMVAAVTTSLPERAEQGRNYDYRYAWIRDQCYAGQAAAAAGGTPLLDAAVAFVGARLLEDGPHLKPAYTVDGGRVPDERTLDLAGYPGGSDIVGNWVNGQFQLDALGESLLLFAAADKLDRLTLDGERAIHAAIAAIEKRWRDPDAGIWELENRHWAHSRLMCAAGLRAIATRRNPSQAADWAAFADVIVADVGRDCLHPSGRWQRSPHDERVDASLLLPAIRGAVATSDPRSVATWEAVRHELGRDGYVYRFRQDERPLNEAEGAFVLCGFQMALATHQQGDLVEAARWFERNRAALGPPGLFTEEFDVVERQLRGNLPQAFVHALFIESAVRLSHEPTTDTEHPAQLGRQQR